MTVITLRDAVASAVSAEIPGSTRGSRVD